MIKKVNLGVIAVAILLITGFAQRAEAFPLPTMDMKKLMDNAKIVMNQVQEIKAEVESNMHIIQEIQNGGFGAAVNDLFGKIENGDYDRFGNRLKTIKKASQDSLDEVKDSQTRSKAEKEARKKGMSKEEAQKYADEKVAEQQAKREEERMLRAQAQAEAKANRQKTGIEKAYNWLKDNRSVTDAVRSGATAAQSGNWGGVASSVLAGTGDTLSANGKGNSGSLLTGLAGNAGNMVNSATSGNWGGVASSALSGVGGAVTGANQTKMEKCAAGDTACEARNQERQKKANAGNLVSGLAGNAGNMVNSATSGNWGGVASSALSGVGGAVTGANQNKMEKCATGDTDCEARNQARQNKTNTGNLLTGLAGNAGNMVNSATSGNWGGVASSALSGVGNTVANASQNKMETCKAGDADCEARNKARQNKTTIGKILSDTAGDTGNMVNSAASGNWGAAIGSAGKGVATGLTSGGNAKVGDIVSKASAGAAGAVNAAQ
ncbi:MAG: hypothetical protein J6N49_03970, partial [Alphaproteobacteria bacterium]|nr:hypothetical protein [Alphaproteobacteria bacterium]